MKDFLKILRDTERFEPSHWGATHLKYTLGNGSYIEFFGADQLDKVTGPRRDVLYVNECNHINFETYHQLAIRTSQDIYLDYNPTHRFWVHNEVLQDEDVDFLKLNYQDNEALPQTIREEIEKARDKAERSAYWKNWWKVYGLGELGSLQGTVYEDWQTISQLPHEAQLLGYGLDFGFTNDPTALVAIYRYDGTLIADELIYQTRLHNSDIIHMLKQSPKAPIYADSAEPKSIAEIARAGLPIYPVQKTKDSLEYGIQLLQNGFSVTEQSHNLMNELRHYIWKKDAMGQATNQPIDTHNHALDAFRYWALMAFGKSRNAKYRGGNYG